MARRDIFFHFLRGVYSAHMYTRRREREREKKETVKNRKKEKKKNFVVRERGGSYDFLGGGASSLSTTRVGRKGLYYAQCVPGAAYVYQDISLCPKYLVSTFFFSAEIFTKKSASSCVSSLFFFDSVGGASRCAFFFTDLFSPSIHPAVTETQQQNALYSTCRREKGEEEEEERERER